MDFSNSHPDFFEDNAHYVISEYNKDNPDLIDRSAYVVERDEYENLVFKNLYTYICSDGNVHKDIMLNPKSLQIEERIEDSRIKKCYTNNYKIDNGTLSLDERELVFNITPGEWNDSTEFSVISIKKV
ncbi:hypothetical protein [Wolbachia endosymbiont (group A) of Bibio marci]|uniref:hypothetical protein n=1 Tax=Wolbachia endosymbiont (group A) of Bibio marci TaxID=2953987 RepID=UPI00222E3D05|nr:hypothetical protein [Wolbachia endosymbiont (group A) of Bibio marci]